MALDGGGGGGGGGKCLYGDRGERKEVEGRRKKGKKGKEKRGMVVCADAMATVIEACKAGAKIVDLCDAGDSYINAYV